MRGNGEAGGDEKGAEVQRVARVGVGTSRRQAVVLHDVPRRPRSNGQAGESDRRSDYQGQQGGTRDDEVPGSEQESEGYANATRQLAIQSASSFSRWRAITIR